MVEKPETVVCGCCNLDVPERRCGPITIAGLTRGWRCRKCNDHQGNPLKMAQDHEDEVRIRWDQTVDELHAALDQADAYEGKMQTAYQARDSAVRRLEKVQRFHRTATHGGCVCGKHNCEILVIVDDEWVNKRITSMHRHGNGF